jgi:hypothetical protein
MVAESQVKVSESQVRISESQARAIDDLLRSSHRLEQFAIYLLIVNVVSVLVIYYINGLFNGPLGITSFVGFIVAILGMTAIAFRWPSLIRRNSNIRV